MIEDILLDFDGICIYSCCCNNKTEDAKLATLIKTISLADCSTLHVCTFEFSVFDKFVVFLWHGHRYIIDQWNVHVHFQQCQLYLLFLLLLWFLSFCLFSCLMFHLFPDVLYGHFHDNDDIQIHSNLYFG